MFSARVLENGDIRLDCNPDVVYQMLPQEARSANRQASEGVVKITHGDIFYFLWLFAPHLFPENIRSLPIDSLNSAFHTNEVINHGRTDEDMVPSHPTFVIGSDFVCEGAKHLFTEPVREYLRTNLDKLVCFLNAMKVAPLLESNHTPKVTSSAAVCTSDVMSKDFLSVITRSGIRLNLTDGPNQLATMVLDTRSVKAETLPAYERSLYDTFNSFMRSFRSSYENERNTETYALKVKLANSKKKYIMTGLKLADVVKEGGWKVVSADGGAFFEYNKKIVVDKVIGPIGTVYKLPKDLIGTMFLNKIRVPIEPTITNSVVGIGIHPHRSGDWEDTDTTKAWKKLCIGDMENQPIERLNSILDMYKTAHFMSMYAGLSSKGIHYLMGEEENRFNRPPDRLGDWQNAFLARFKSHENLFKRTKRKTAAVFSSGLPER